MERLSPREAAALLQTQKGFAGYSLIADATESGDSSLGHALFCPNCGNEVASVYVNFAGPRPPLPGSRLAILTDLARDAQASPPKKKREMSAPQPVVAAR